MNAEDRIIKAFAAKNWKLDDYNYEKISHGDEGREGGYEVLVQLENYPGMEALSTEDYWALYDKYGKAFDAVDVIMQQRAVASQGKHNCECTQGGILAYYLDDVLFIASQIPDRLNIQ